MAGWLLALLSVLAISTLSFLGAVTFVVRRERLEKVLPYLVSFAAGALLGNAFLHLIPHVADHGLGVPEGLAILSGIVVFFTLERFIHWHQHGHADHAEVAPYAWVSLLGDGLHNFVDGLIITAAFLQDRALGFSTAAAVALHELPQELGDVSVLLHGKLPRGKALLLNFLTGLIALLGVGAALLLRGVVGNFEHVVLAVTAGGFIYIACADLMPELHRELRIKASLLQLTCLVGGALLMLVV